MVLALSLFSGHMFDHKIKLRIEEFVIIENKAYIGP